MAKEVFSIKLARTHRTKELSSCS